MKILIYIEPHPIRNNLLEYSNVAKVFADMLLQADSNNLPSYELKIFCNPLIYDKLIDKRSSKILNSFLFKPNDETWNRILAFYDKWDEAAIKTWSDLYKGIGPASFFYEEIIRDLVKLNNFDTIITWGQNGAVKNISKDLPLNHVIMELGPFRSPICNTIQMQVRNVYGNYENIDLKKIPDRINTINKMHKIYESFSNLLSFKIKILNYFLQKNIGKNILIPLQLRDDSNIVNDSEYDSMLDFLEELLPQLKKYTIYIKPHPNYKSRSVNRKDHTACNKYCKQFRNVFWMDQFKLSKYNNQIVNGFDFILSVNSSIIYDGIIANKRVVVFGKSRIFNSIQESSFKFKGLRKYEKFFSGDVETSKVVFFDKDIIFNIENFMNLMNAIKVK
jgi:hypothetical protein